MLDELAVPSLDGVTVRVAPGAHPVVIIRTAPRTFLVEGSDAPRVERVAEELRTRGIQQAWAGRPSHSVTDAGIPISYDTSLKLEPFARALAKVALNYVCYRLGSDVALRPGFDAVRQFARHGVGNWIDFVTPALLSGGDRGFAEPWVTGDQHSLLLVGADGQDRTREVCFVTISGKYVGKVEFQPNAPHAEGLPVGTWLTSRLDPNNRTIKDFELPRDLVEAVVNPEALRLAEQFAGLKNATG